LWLIIGFQTGSGTSENLGTSRSLFWLYLLIIPDKAVSESFIKLHGQFMAVFCPGGQVIALVLPVFLRA